MSQSEQDPIPERDLLWDVRERALRYLNSVWVVPDKSCPICGTDNWTVGDVSLLPVRSGDAGTPFANRGFPLVPVTCHECGYMFFLNERWVREGGTPEDIRAQESPQ